jgi:phosphatidylglycerol---prolipoprotein diacylglyceryl transferase
MQNYLFKVFGWPITFYGILIMLGTVAAAFLAANQAKKRGQDPEIIWDIFLYVLTAGIIGARLWHVFTPPPSMVAQGITTAWYFAHPLEILYVWRGGLGIPGAILGGGLALYIYTRIKKINFGMWADFAAPGVALAQAIGRWGNFFNQEVYGMPSTLPWAITIDPQYRLPEFMSYTTYHPLFLYESIWNLLNMGLLLYLGKRFEKWLKNGDIFLVFLMFYSLGRFLLEFLRLDAAQVGGINFNQTVVAVVALVSAALFIWRHSQHADIFEKKPTAAERIARRKAEAGKTEDAKEKATPAVKPGSKRTTTSKTAGTAVKPAAKKTVKTTTKSVAKSTAKPVKTK